MAGSFAGRSEIARGGVTLRSSTASGRLRDVAVAFLVCLSVGGCAPAAAQNVPIVVATISSLVGDESTAEGIAAARAYFESINEAGGIRGRLIEYRVIDDRMDPAVARKAIAQLVRDTRMVALAGGSSVLACAVTADALAQADLYDLPAGGVDADCFRSSHIVPVNAGPYVSTHNAMTFARTELEKSQLCAVVPSVPGEPDDFVPAVTRWHRQLGGDRPELFRYESDTSLATLSTSPALSSCDAMVFVGPENAGMAWTKVFRPLWPRTPIVLMTTSYASRTASELARMGDGIYAMAEFDPWSASSLASTDWRRLMLKKKLPLSSLSQGGYLAAQMLVRQLFTIRGAITRTTVSEALRAMPAWNSGMTHMPLRVDARGNHELNRSGLPMQLQHGRWRIAHPTWITH
jgi:branched-chain amino acid transport system substrate-binding protein